MDIQILQSHFDVSITTIKYIIGVPTKNFFLKISFINMIVVSFIIFHLLQYVLLLFIIINVLLFDTIGTLSPTVFVF